MKITFEFTDNGEDDKVKAKRAMCADDAFSMLWEIHRRIERHRDNEDVIEADNKDCLDAIYDDISESKLLDLWQ